MGVCTCLRTLKRSYTRACLQPRFSLLKFVFSLTFVSCFSMGVQLFLSGTKLHCRAYSPQTSSKTRWVGVLNAFGPMASCHMALSAGTTASGGCLCLPKRRRSQASSLGSVQRGKSQQDIGQLLLLPISHWPTLLPCIECKTGCSM